MLFLNKFRFAKRGTNMNNELKKDLDDNENMRVMDEYIDLIEEHWKDDITCIELNKNKPIFTEDDKKKLEENEDPFFDLDELGRCRAAFTCIVGKKLNNIESLKFKSRIKPTAWKSIGCEAIKDGKCLYNRCHLIARQFYIKKVNKRGLITGTRNFNADGMFEYEDKVANYIKENPEHHILYRVKPYFRNSNLLACGVQMEILDLDDEGKLSYNVFIYNKQHGFTIDYRNGDVYSDNPLSLSGKRLGYNIYVIDKDTGKFHKESCASVCDIKNKKYFAGKEQTIEEKYCKCDICIS